MFIKSQAFPSLAVCYQRCCSLGWPTGLMWSLMGRIRWNQFTAGLGMDQELDNKLAESALRREAPPLRHVSNGRNLQMGHGVRRFHGSLWWAAPRLHQADYTRGGIIHDINGRGAVKGKCCKNQWGEFTLLRHSKARIFSKKEVSCLLSDRGSTILYATQPERKVEVVRQGWTLDKVKYTWVDADCSASSPLNYSELKTSSI